jgi:formylglycine-generating enzyme required for sulfatase activity
VKVVKLRANYLSLQGYRLPTEAEMEYATRAGAITSRFFGEKEDLVPKYGWYGGNSQHLTWPVGILKPNDFGLFDVLGNVLNWCQERWRTTPRAASEDKEDLALDVEPKRHRKTRGASFASRVSQVRSASGHSLEPEDDVTYNGFRVARTILLDPLTTYLAEGIAQSNRS